jgi:phosphohistidine phosphatase SixA
MSSPHDNIAIRFMTRTTGWAQESMKRIGTNHCQPFFASRRTSICASVCLYLLVAGLCTSLFATVTSQINGTIVVTSASAQQPIVPSFAVSDEPFALGEALIRELRRGGYNIYLRHGSVIPNTVDQQSTGEWWKNCATTQRLTPQAMPQAQLVALALLSQRVQVDEILTSEFCRAADTALFLGIVAPKKVAALNDYAATASVTPNKRIPITDWAKPLVSLLATLPTVGRNRILVGHATPANSVHPTLSTLAEGHAAIFRPEGNNRFHLVATLSPGQWQALSRQSIPELAPANAGTGVALSSPLPSTPPPPPVIDPAKELKGTAIVAALRKGGYNLYIRHGTATDGQDQPNLVMIDKWWDNCAIQRKIVDAGREQARKVGAALKQLKVPIAVVKVSQFCRVRDTATLMDVGPIEVTEDLNHQLAQRMNFDVNTARFTHMIAMPPKGKNVVLVSHTHSSQQNTERIMAQLQEAEMVMFAPDGKGNTEPVARILFTDWESLIRLTESGGK